MIYEVPDLWVAAVSALIPLISALAVRQDGSNVIRALIAVVASAVLAVVQVAVGDGSTIDEYVSLFITVLATQFVSYKAILGPIFDVNEVIAPSFGLGSSDDGAMGAGK